MENAFDNLALAIAEVTSELRVILPAAKLARDYHVPVRAWASDDCRRVELQRQLHSLWEQAVINGLDHNSTFNIAWGRALRFARREHILFAAID